MWKRGRPVWVSCSGALALIISVTYLGFGVDRKDFWSLFGTFIIAFGAYLSLVYRPQEGQLRWLVVLGVALRVLLVFAFPLLSDDIYRFIWDGHLIMAGQNPFAELPIYYLETGKEIPGLTPELFSLLNSPGYYTIYPPVAQAVFTVAAWVSPTNWYGAAVVMKLFLLACELGSLWLLLRLFTPMRKGRDSTDLHKGGAARSQDAKVVAEQTSLPVTNILFYWLNPLVIVEVTGNLHFEGAMVFFLLLAFYLLKRNRLVAGAVAMAASVASKLLPLMLLPLLIRRLWPTSPPVEKATEPGYGKYRLIAWLKGGRRFYVFSVAFGVACLAFFTPLLVAPDFLEGFQSSLELYQKKFEFNASVYYVARAIGYLQVGWNRIATVGPLLAQIAAAGILLLALLDKRRAWDSLPEGWMWAFVLYLLFATTVHPWYLCVPVVLCCFTTWRFPLVWSFLIMLTYVSYVTEPYRELLWLVAAEYLLVAGFAIWEWRRSGISKESLGSGAKN